MKELIGSSKEIIKLDLFNFIRTYKVRFYMDRRLSFPYLVIVDKIKSEPYIQKV